MSFGVMSPTVSEQQPATILATKAVGPWIDISRWRAGAFRTPAAATATSYTFNVAVDGAAYVLRDAAGAAITQTVVAAKWFALPAALFNYKQVQMVPNATPVADQAVIVSGVDGPATWRRISYQVIGGVSAFPAFDIGGATAGCVFIPVGFTGTTITLEIGGGTGQLSTLASLANANVVLTLAADRLVSLPPEAFGAPYVRVVTGSPQGAPTVLDFWLKQLG